MSASSRSKRVLLYSHDSYGLGHVSRCRTIANAIVEADSSISVLIISGSPMIGSYEFRSGIDFVRIPGVEAPAIGQRIRVAAPRDKLHLFSADGRRRIEP